MKLTVSILLWKQTRFSQNNYGYWFFFLAQTIDFGAKIDFVISWSTTTSAAASPRRHVYWDWCPKVRRTSGICLMYLMDWFNLLGFDDFFNVFYYYIKISVSGLKRTSANLRIKKKTCQKISWNRRVFHKICGKA